MRDSERLIKGVQLSQTILGIDLGSYSVKVVELFRHSSDLELVGFYEEPLDLQSRASHQENVHQALHKIFTDHQIKADVTCMSYPGHLTSSRLIKLPVTSRKDVDRTIEFSLEEYVPFEVEDLFIDSHILRVTENGSEVLALYTPLEKLESYYEVLVGDEIDPKYWGADFSDVAGLSQVGFVPKEGLYALVDIGHLKTNVLLMEGDQLRYVRTIGLGGYHFTRAIQRAFNLNQEKAEAMKLSRGRVHMKESESDQVSRILGKVASELVAAIKQTFLGAYRQGLKENVQALYCFGGGTRLVGIDDYLSFHLKVNVFPLDVLSFIKNDLEHTKEIESAIPQALASALRPIYSTKIPRINFRKGPFAFKQDVEFLTKELKVVGVLMALLLGIGVAYWFYAGNYYKARMARIEKQIDNVVKTEFKEIAPLTKNERRGKSSLKIVKTYTSKVSEQLQNLKEFSPQLLGEAGGALVALHDVSKFLPPKLEVELAVKQFTYSDGFVRLVCVTNNRRNKEKVVESLKENPNFSSIDASEEKELIKDMWEFTLKINL